MSAVSAMRKYPFGRFAIMVLASVAMLIAALAERVGLAEPILNLRNSSRICGRSRQRAACRERPSMPHSRM